MPKHTALVMDNGSGWTKFGLSGDDAPRAVFPSVVGQNRLYGMTMHTGLQKDAYVGDEAIAKQSVLSLKYPIEHGTITDWENMEKLWHHTFYHELQMAPEEHPVLLTEAPLNFNSNREKTIQIMFETFNVPQFYLGSTPALSLYASGRTTGCVVDSGHCSTHVVPIHEGYYIPLAVQRSDVGGKSITENLQKILTEQGCSLTRKEIVRDIKEKLCYFAHDFDSEIAKYAASSTDLQQTYKLPDGEVIHISHEMIRAPEIFYKPELFDMHDQVGIVDLIVDGINICDGDIRAELYGNIVACGGNSMLRGFTDRLQFELTRKVEKSVLVDGWIRKWYDTEKEHALSDDIKNLVKLFTAYKAKIIAAPERKYLAWLGGSILSSLSTFEEMWIEKAEYEDAGPTIVHRKLM